MMQAILKGHQIHPNVTLGETFEGVSGFCNNNETEMLLQIIYLFFEHPRFDLFTKTVSKMPRVFISI